MKLTELDPQWLLKDGERVGLMFRCPLEPINPHRLQSCFFVALPSTDQLDLVMAVIGENSGLIVQLCNPQMAWACTPSLEEATFDNISITPSIDGSAGGNWHGYITNGEILTV